MTSPIWSTEAASLLARFAHHGQVDKSGADYYLHPMRVVEICQRSPEWYDLSQSDRYIACMAAWLHDVLEDTYITEEMLHDLMAPLEVIELVKALTHHPHERRTTYYERIKEAGPLAVMIKRADITDNLSPIRMSLLDDKSQERLKTKYAEALESLTNEATGGRNDRNTA